MKFVVPPSLVSAIISRELSSASCRRILSGDGVSSPDLSVKPLPGMFAGVSIDVRSGKKAMPALGEAASAAKNLDEYQFLICSLVPSLADSEPPKMELQKYRVAILAAFSRLVSILNSSPNDLGEWSRHARWLVEETSEAYLQAKTKVQLHPMRHKEVFTFFGVPEEELTTALKSFYARQ